MRTAEAYLRNSLKTRPISPPRIKMAELFFPLNAAMKRDFLEDQREY